jgi:hypothetical protein
MVKKDVGKALELKCDNMGTDPLFEGPSGKTFRIKCPKGCAKSAGAVMGTQVYNDESSVCKSALHSGFLKDDGEG